MSPTFHNSRQHTFTFFSIFYIRKQEYLFHLAFNLSWIGNKWTTGILWFDIVPTVFCSIAYKIPNRIFLAMTKPLHEQKSRAMLLPVIRQTIIRTMGLKKCNNEPLHDEKRPRKTEVFVQLFIFKWWPELNFLVLKKIPGRLVFSEHNFILWLASCNWAHSPVYSIQTTKVSNISRNVQ